MTDSRELPELPEHSELPELGLSLQTTASVDELRTTWHYLGELVEKTGADMTGTGQRWKDATDVFVKNDLWMQYEVVAREYRVVSCWRDVFYAAYIFATDGAACAALDVNSAPLS